jgi:hypothetical protein
MTWMTMAPMPTRTLIPAAIQTAACIPKNGKMSVALARQAAPAPSVLTKYRIPTALPIWPELLTSQETRIGSVAHQQCRNQHQRQVDSSHGSQRQIRNQMADLFEDASEITRRLRSAIRSRRAATAP